MRFVPLPLLLAAVALLHRLAAPASIDRALPDPAGAAMSGVRYVALALGWYLVTAVSLGVAARLGRWAGAAAVLDTASPVFVRRAARALAGGLIVIVSVGAAGPAAAGKDEERPPVLRHLPEEDGAYRRAEQTHPPRLHRPPPPSPSPSTRSTTPLTSAPATATPATAAPATATGSPSTTSTSATTSTSTTSTTALTTTTTGAPSSRAPGAPPAHVARERAPAPATPAPSPTSAVLPPSARSWTVRPGDHFWSIAERHLTATWGRSPTSAEVASYWRHLIEANRSRLADSDNPDLIFPGQLMELPPAPRPPAAPGGARH